MNFQVTLPLQANAEQAASLVGLQRLFAQACNLLSVLARDNRCWNRVALHHLGYKLVRVRFPQLGSQMACNAVYSVSRSCRLVYQSPGSPFNVLKLGLQPLPLIRFADSCPVYFDRHTVSIKAQRLSMFTLDGRVKFDVALADDQLQAFHSKKLKEIVLSRNGHGVYSLQFLLQEANVLSVDEGAVAQGPAWVPDYLNIEEVV
jgi:hypothetical protein